VRRREGAKLPARRASLRSRRGITSAGVISIWLGLSLIAIGGQAFWSLFQSMLHSDNLEIITYQVLRGPGSSTYLVVLVRNNSSEIANDVQAFVQIGKQPFTESSSKLVPSALQINPTQEVVFVFDNFHEATPSNLHFKIDAGHWTSLYLVRSLPSINGTYSRGALHANWVNSTPFTTPPMTLVALVFGPGRDIQAFGSMKTAPLRPSASVVVNVPVTIGNLSSWRTPELLEDS
jgi:hypothetical protein